MKQQIKNILALIGLILLLTSASIAKKQFVPIVNDDILSMASYNTSIDKLTIPDLEAENLAHKLIVQCEEDIAYFVYAYTLVLDDTKTSIASSSGNVVIDREEHLNDMYGYIRGHIDGEESMIISVNKTTMNPSIPQTTWQVASKACRSHITSENKLKVPTFNGNTQGKLVVQCEDDVVYYIMAYDCLRSWTNPTATADNGVAVVDEKKHVGEVFYVKGHVERKNANPVTITGKLLNEFDKRVWTKTCP